MAVLQYSPNLQDGVLLAFWTVLKIILLVLYYFLSLFQFQIVSESGWSWWLHKILFIKKFLTVVFYFMRSKCYIHTELVALVWHQVSTSYWSIAAVFSNFLLQYCRICWMFCSIAEFTTPQYPPLYVVHHWYLGSIPRSKCKT